jgi:hypothetical protein
MEPHPVRGDRAMWTRMPKEEKRWLRVCSSLIAATRVEPHSLLLVIDKLLIYLSKVSNASDLRNTQLGQSRTMAFNDHRGRSAHVAGHQAGWGEFSLDRSRPLHICINSGVQVT